MYVDANSRFTSRLLLLLSAPSLWCLIDKRLLLKDKGINIQLIRCCSEDVAFVFGPLFGNRMTRKKIQEHETAFLSTEVPLSRVQNNITVCQEWS